MRRSRLGADRIGLHELAGATNRTLLPERNHQPATDDQPPANPHRIRILAT